MSAEDPKKCCRVLLTWQEEYFKFERWSSSKADTPPPGTVPVPEDEVNRFKEQVIAKLLEFKDLSLYRKINVKVDQNAAIRNASDFSGVPTPAPTASSNTEDPSKPVGYTRPGRPRLMDSQPTYIDGTGKCTRLNQTSSKICNCANYDPNTGNVVKGSEKCISIPPEKFNIRKSTKEVEPEYWFGGSLTYEYFNAAAQDPNDPSKKGAWEIIGPKAQNRARLRGSFENKKIPVKREDWELRKNKCTRKKYQEMDCCK
jgi:hypothetical protein